MSKKRPLGITILSLLGFISAAITLVVGAGIMLLGGAAFLGTGTWMTAFAAMGAALGIIFIIYGLIQGAISFGLWTMQKWAWMVAMITYSVSLLYSLYTVDISTIIAGAIVISYLYIVRKKFR